MLLSSSDNDNTGPFPSRTTSARRVSPVSVSSTADSSESEDNGQTEALAFLSGYVSSNDYERAEITEDEEEDDSAIVVEAESSGTSSSSPDKGKGKEVDTQEPLNMQEELECFICCIFPPCEILIIANLMIAPHICSPCGHGGCGPCSTISSK